MATITKDDVIALMATAELMAYDAYTRNDRPAQSRHVREFHAYARALAVGDIERSFVRERTQ